MNHKDFLEQTRPSGRSAAGARAGGFQPPALLMMFVSALLLCLLTALPGRGDPVSVLTQHNDNARTGANLQEKTLTTSNVNVAGFGKLFSRAVDGQIYAQPLYVPRVGIHKMGKRNVVYVATEHNSVYAFDADDPTASAPYWQVNLGPSCPWSDFYTPPVTDMNEEVGITGTPVIDPKSKTLYVVAKTKENGAYFQRLHALDIETGQEKFGGPVVIQATVIGKGEGSANGVVGFDAKQHLQRPGLLLANGMVYVAFGSHGDHEPFHGWLLAYDAATLQKRSTFNTTPDGGEGAIWQAGQAPAADAQGNLYVMTGNGTSDGQTGGQDYGDCMLKLTPNLTVADWFLPYNWTIMNQYDIDLGSSGAVLLPGTDFVVGGSKASVLYLLKTDHLGHFHAGDDSQILQSFQASTGHIHGSPIFWNSPGGPRLYLWSENNHLREFALTNGQFGTTPFAQSATIVPPGMPGGFLSLSADEGKPGTGIVWASHPLSENANWNTVDGILQAFDASDVSKELWNSRMNPARDDVGKFAKFCPPTVVNGRVYLATFSKQLVVYSLLPVGGKK